MENIKQGLTFETLPKAVSFLIDEVRELKKLVLKNQLKKSVPVNTIRRIPVDINRATEITHLGKSSIYSLRKKKKFPGGMKKGQKLLWYEDELLQWIESGKVLSPEEIDAASDAALLIK
jgi:predicted DNA-binding transcriptional regulator AlpA